MPTIDDLGNLLNITQSRLVDSLIAFASNQRPTTVPVNISSPAITGDTHIGSTLTAIVGTWANFPASYRLQWQFNGSNILGQSGYTLDTTGRAGGSYTCVVTATNALGDSQPATSNSITMIAPISVPSNTAAPVISGSTTIGSTLSATMGTWTNSPTAYSYQWMANGSNIGGATSSTLNTTGLNAGPYVCVVVASNAGGASSPATSNTLTMTSATPIPVNSVAPAVTGSTTVGSTLTTTSGTWSNSPTSYAYKWQEKISSVWTDVAGATSTTFVPMHNGTYRSLVSATNAGGTAAGVGSNSVTMTGGAVGAVGGKGAVVQKSTSQSFNGVGPGANTFAMPGNFTAGNSAVVAITWYSPAGNVISGVTINGTAATLVYRDLASTASEEYWMATNLAGGSASVSVTTAAGTGQYVNACCVETTPLDVLDTTNTGTGTSTTPTFTTSSALTQLDELVLTSYRDNTGVNNTASTPVTSPLIQGYFQADGVNNLGAAFGYKLQTARTTATGSFAINPSTQWFGSIAAIKFKMPVVDCGQAVKFWHGAGWSPTTLSRVVSSGTNKLLVTVGGWWDDNSPSAATALPTDSTGATFTAIYNPTKPDSSRPVVVQTSYLATPSTATHTITPPNVGSAGDGYLVLLEIPGVDTSGDPVRDKGRTLLSHAAVTPPDPNTYQSVTVATAGSSAQVGDIAVLAVVIDMNSTPSNVQFVPPAGWQMVRNNYDSTDNVSFIVCTSKVTTAGQISATTTWTDPNTFIVDAQLIVFKHQ